MADDDSPTPYVQLPPPFEKRLEAAMRRMDLFPTALIQDRDAMDDIVQETALRVLHHLAKVPGAFDPPGALEAFMREASYNLALDLLKKRRRAEKHAIAHEAEREDAKRRSMDPRGPVLARDTYVRVAAALSRLPAHLREAWLVYAGEAISQAEAAQLCGVATGSLKRYVASVVGPLRAALRGIEHGGLTTEDYTPRVPESLRLDRADADTDHTTEDPT